jgi:hypothetical protein
MITTGVTGGTWRATITPWGAVAPAEAPDAATLDWYVAADDRWHVPADESAVRQRRIDGTPVTETRVRVPRGDVVQRIYSVPDSGGLTVIEVHNESTLPVAIAFSHRELLTERPIAAVPIEGIELPESAFVMPVGHAATIRVAIAHDGARHRRLPSGLPSPQQVAHGWATFVARAGRLVLPDGGWGAGLAERVTSERCELALGGLADGGDAPERFVVGLHELVRLGEPADPWLPELVEAVEAIGARPGWEADVAIDAAGRLLALAGERRAAADIERIVGRRPEPVGRPAEPPSDVLVVPWAGQLLVRHGRLLPGGIPAEWLGQSFEGYHLPTGRGTTALAFAGRWHGERPAVLWEQTDPGTDLTAPVCAPHWHTTELRGEALWPAPAG